MHRRVVIKYDVDVDVDVNAIVIIVSSVYAIGLNSKQVDSFVTLPKSS